MKHKGIMKLQTFVLLLSLTPLAQSNNCQAKFEEDSELVKNPRIPKNLTEPLVCGIREQWIKFDPHNRSESVTEDGKIVWSDKQCLDNNAIVFTENLKQPQRHLVFQCISTGPIQVLYSGQLPAVGNMYSSYYLRTTQKHVTIIHVPLEFSKSGNYTFKLLGPEDPSTKWFYVFFKTSPDEFIRSHSKKITDQTYEDPRDPSKIIVPCQANAPENRDVCLENATANNISFQYDPKRGIVIDKANFKNNLQLISIRKQKYGSPQYLVHCKISIEGYNLTTQVLVNLNRTLFSETLGGSSELSLQTQNNSTLECSFSPNSDNKPYYMNNIYFITSSEWRFLYSCALKKANCEWNLHWTDKGDFQANKKAVLNKKYEFCHRSPCHLKQPFKSGLIRCATNDDAKSFVGLYFTGLDNQLYMHHNQLPSNITIQMYIKSPINSGPTDTSPTKKLHVTCKAVYFVVLPGFNWTLVFLNGSTQPIPTENNHTYLSLIKNPTLNIGEFEETLNLEVPKDADKLICEALARDTNNLVSASLVIRHSPPASSKIFNVGVFPLVTVVCVGLIVAFISVITISRNHKKQILSRADISYFLNGQEIIRSVSDENIYVSQPYKKEKEIDFTEFTIDKDLVLGSGSYGIVLKGTVRGVEVAVKTVKPNTERDVLLALLAEIKVMSSLDEHPNLVSFIGARTNNIAKGEVYLFVEFCPLGSVEGFLRKTKLNMRESNTYEDKEETYLLTSLLNWSMQTALGMQYLSDRKVIHGDLAVRNLLLKDMRTVKITDFGLARQLHNYSIYQKTQQQPLPWRHMSPESLSEMEFSVKSDVWAFGVTLWEMFSLGAIPYSGLQWTVGFTSQLDSGLRLDRPEFCSPALFAVIKRCWELIPKARPDFNELIDELDQIHFFP